MQCNPIIVNGVLYATSPKLRVFALDAATGKLIWSFNPPNKEGGIGKLRNRGVTWWDDGEDGRIYVNSNEMAWILRLVERPKAGGRQTGRTLYRSYCASCHREDLKGTPPEFPSLVEIAKRHTEAEVEGIICKGAGRMPAFSNLSDEAAGAITAFLVGREAEVQTAPEIPSPMDLKYTMDGYNKFLDPDGYPPFEPPWGTLNAIDLDKGTIAWQIPFGEFPELAPRG